MIGTFGLPLCLCAECTDGMIQDLWGKLLLRWNAVISTELTSGWQSSHSPRTAPRHAGAAAHPSVNRPSWTTRDHSDANPRQLRLLWTPQTSDRPLGQSSMRGSAKGSAGAAPCAAPRDGTVVKWPQTAGPMAALPLEAGACTPDGPVSVVDERPRHDCTDGPRSTVCGAVTDSNARTREATFIERPVVREQSKT